MPSALDRPTENGGNMRDEHPIFSKYSKLDTALTSVRRNLLREVGKLTPEELDRVIEDSVASRLMELAPSGVTAEFPKRFAKVREEPDGRSAHGPFITVVYHIPVSGNLDLLGYMPSDTPGELSLGATWVGTPDESRNQAYPTYKEGHILYELPADMDSEKHRACAASASSEIETLVESLNAEVQAFRPSLDSAVRSALAERRDRTGRTATTLGSLDVPIQD